jgi:hypothetical protein
VFLVPICCLVHALLPRILFTPQWTRAVTAFTSCLLLARKLLQTELASYWLLNWKLKTGTGFTLNSLYNLHANHTENISRIWYCWNVCTSHCIATVAALTIANLLLLRYPATSSKHSFFYCCVPFEVSVASIVTAWGKRHNILLNWNFEENICVVLWLSEWTLGIYV